LLSLRDGFCFAKRVRGRLFFHCVAGFSLPRGLGAVSLVVTARRLLFCQAGARPLVACSPPLAARRDSLDRDPAARSVPGPLGVSRFAGSPTPRPGPRAGSPRPRETWPLAPAWRFETPTLRLETLKPGRTVRCQDLPSAPFEREVGVKSAPRATGAIAPERAGPERADRCVETWAAEGRTTRVRAAIGTTRSHAMVGRRAALDAQPERPGSEPAGQKEASRNERQWPGRAPAWQKRTRGATRKPPRSGK
jgi:hypothetical protein